MHQQQWLAVIEELGGPEQLPIRNSFPREQEKQDVAYAFSTMTVDGGIPDARRSHGRSLDGRGEFHTERAKPAGEEPVLSSPPPERATGRRDRRHGQGRRPLRRSGNAVDRGTRAIERPVHRLRRDRMERDAETLAVALMRDLIDADDFTARASRWR